MIKDNQTLPMVELGLFLCCWLVVCSWSHLMIFSEVLVVLIHVLNESFKGEAEAAYKSLKIGILLPRVAGYTCIPLCDILAIK